MQTVFQNNNLMIKSKPIGVPFHQTAQCKGVMQILREQHPDTPLYPVHRLDQGTSGLLIVAKSEEAANQLITAFRERKVHKYYVGLSNRKPKKKMGTVAGFMTKSRGGSWILQNAGNNTTTTDSNKIAPTAAVTRFTSIGVGEQGQLLRAFLLKPETGKTHQLRVALKALGSPVLGDARYANKLDSAQFDRMYLHCAALRFQVLDDWIQVAEPPQEGALFQTPQFQRVYNEWFTPDMLQEDVWFADNKLLRSSRPTEMLI